MKVTKRKIARIIVGSILVLFGIVLGTILVADILKGKNIIEVIFFPPNFGWLVSLVVGGFWYDRLGKIELRGPWAITIGTVLFFIFLFILMTATSAGVVWYRGQEFFSVPAKYFLLAGILLFLSHVLSFSQWKTSQNKK